MNRQRKYHPLNSARKLAFATKPMLEIASHSKRTHLILIAAVVSAAAYLLLPLAEGSVIFIATKASGCLLLALAAFLAVQDPKTRNLIVLALLLSSLGDIFLAIRSADYFIQGLGSFLVAHLLYIVIFVHARSQVSLSRPNTFLIALITVFAILMMWKLWPLLGQLKAPVYIYISAISFMAIAAVFSRFKSTLVISGALSFLVSDAIIAIDKFIIPFSLSSTLIWVTYFSAQLLLTLAILKGPESKNADLTPAQ